MRVEQDVSSYESERAALFSVGYRALLQTLGCVDTVRFLAWIPQSPGDYLELQERIFGEASVDELYDRSEAHWK